MILKYFRNLSSILLLAAAPALAAVNPDQEFLGAYDAYRAGNPMKLARHAKFLNEYPLKPWVDYWQLAVRLEDKELLAKLNAAIDAIRANGTYQKINAKYFPIDIYDMK